MNSEHWALVPPAWLLTLTRISIWVGTYVGTYIPATQPCAGMANACMHAKHASGQLEADPVPDIRGSLDPTIPAWVWVAQHIASALRRGFLLQDPHQHTACGHSAFKRNGAGVALARAVYESRPQTRQRRAAGPASCGSARLPRTHAERALVVSSDRCHSPCSYQVRGGRLLGRESSCWRWSRG